MDFLRQENDPLFPKLLWTRPVGGRRAGRLLLVGGHINEFNAIQNVYAAAIAAEVGDCQVVLPDSLRKILGENGFTYVPSTHAGSVAKDATAQILGLAEDADAVALGASLSSNSETATVVESILTKTKKPAVLFDEVFNLMKFHPDTLIGENRLIIATMPDLFKLAAHLKIGIDIKESSLVGKLEIIKNLVEETDSQFLIYGPELIVAVGDQISVTHWQPVPATVLFGITSVLWLQNLSKPFEALTSAAFLVAQASKELPEEHLTQPELLKIITKTIRSASEQF